MTEMAEVRSPEEIRTVVDLAREIWTEHYVPIIGQAQVDYMLAGFQSEAAVADQIREGYRYFVIRADGRPAGYLAVAADPSTRRMLLSKIYVLKSQRGRGLGRTAIACVEELCRETGMEVLWLRVNKNNQDSIGVYERCGFVKTGVVVSDIGNGFVMDDFQLEKRVRRVPAPA